MADDQSSEGMNWADVAYMVVALPAVLVHALASYMVEVATLFAVTSKAIDRRKAFARSVGMDIESLTGGDRE